MVLPVAGAKDQGRTLIAHLGPVHHVAASPDGRLVATAGADRKIQLWDTATWKSARRCAVIRKP